MALTKAMSSFPLKRWIAPFFLLLSAASARGVEPITPVQANALSQADKAVIIDVRETAELKETGIAKPAAWLPKSEVDGQSDLYHSLVKTWDKQKPLIFYCRSGKRAAVVAKHFDELGFKTKNMGSLTDWSAAGLPVVPFEKRR